MAVLRVPYCKIVMRYKKVKSAKLKADVAAFVQNVVNAAPAPGENLLSPARDKDEQPKPVLEYDYEFESKETVVVFESGANLLSMTQTNGEGERASFCSFSFRDADFNIDAIMLNRALQAGTIVVPPDLLDAPKEKESTSSSGDGNINVNNNSNADDVAKAIIKYARSVGVNDKSHIAYLLGTVEHESGFKNIKEIGGESAWYAPYYGRGLVQLTHKENYEKFGTFFKIPDLASNPDKVLNDMNLAVKILVHGASGANGSPTFSGHKLSDYGSGSSFDWIGARYVINVQDRASYIAGLGKKWLARLPELESGKTSEGKQVGTQPTPPQTQQDRLNQGQLGPGLFDSAQAAKTAIEGNKIVPDWAVEIEIERGYEDVEDIVRTYFWFTGRSMSTKQRDITSFTGKGFRFLMDTGRKRQTYQNISLRQLVERIGTTYGIETAIPDNPASGKIFNQNQNGENDYQFLVRVAKSSGFTIEADQQGQKLSFKSPKNSPRVKVKKEWGLYFSSEENATTERLVRSLPPIDSLIDGKAIGEGFVTRLETEYPDIELLSLRPGTIIEIPKGVIYGLPDQSAYCREYKLKAITDYYGGTNKVTLDLYIPVHIEVQEESEDSANKDGEKSLVEGIPSISIAWQDANDRVSAFFKVNDVTQNDPRRIPEKGSLAENNVKIMGAHLDKINKEWAKKNNRPDTERVLGVTSWYRPSAVNLEVASSGPNGPHVINGGVDIYPTVGNGVDFENWLDSGLWASKALGYGQKSGQGFTHLDLRDGKIRWDY